MNWCLSTLKWQAFLVGMVVTWGLITTECNSIQESSERTLKELIAAHNQERARAGLPPLRLNDQLTVAAQRHAEDMARSRLRDHTGSDGSTPSRRIRNAGYHYRACGENIAWGQRDVAEVMRFWMNSPIHKKNAIGKFAEIGAAYQDDKDGKRYWCVTFGTRSR